LVLTDLLDGVHRGCLAHFPRDVTVRARILRIARRPLCLEELPLHCGASALERTLQLCVRRRRRHDDRLSAMQLLNLRRSSDTS
jgi:hypothetical protein